jgi:hypothetical protein
MNRVWTYIISKALSASDISAIKQAGENFASSWTAHDQKLTASFEIFKDRVVIVKVNEDVHNASGCSIDKLTRFVKELENKFSIELMNRFLVAYKNNDSVEVVNASEIKDLLQKNIISADTIIYNTSLANSNELIGWEQALKNTWLCKYLDI